MSKRVLRTKFIGYATDSSRHPLAPVEVVYQCEEEKRDNFLLRLWRLSLPKKLTLVMCAISIWGLTRPFFALLG
ncbi:MAG: hypothetical protein AB7T59_11080 [Hyphomonadaceae bacterium]